VLDLAANVHALREEVFADALQRIEAGDLHRDLLEERRTGVFFLLVATSGQHECGGRAEAQERHPSFSLTSEILEPSRRWILREVAAVEADVADLAYADGWAVSVIGFLLRVRIARSAERTRD